MKNVLFMAVITLSLASCADVSSDDSEWIGKKNLTIEDGLMTPEVLWSMGRVSGVHVSPDARELLYSVQYFDIAQDKGNKDLYSISLDGGVPKQLTKTAASESEACWSMDGKHIFYLYEGQLWKMRKDGKHRKQISDLKNEIEGFLLSPNGEKVLYVTQRPYGKCVKDLYKDLDKSTGKVIDDLMYKHWDEWVETIPHPFVADLTKSGIKNAVDLLQDEPYESPMKPWGGVEQLAWSPDGNSIAYTCRKKQGMAYAVSTNSDIYLYNLSNKSTKNLTEGMMGYDTNPVFSPDGKYIAFQSMERDGYEADQDRLFLHVLSSGKNIFLSKQLDGDVSNVCWAADGKTLFFLSALQAVTQIFTVQIDGSGLRQVTNESSDFESLSVAGSGLVGLKHTMSRPNEIFRIQPQTGEIYAITDENKMIFDQLKLGKVEKRMIPTTDGKEVLTWVVYPPDFDSTKVYPAILFCTGGPQGTLGQFWSYRWNLQLMAANGYIVVAPNRRGVSGMGQDWKEQISGDYGGQEMKDLFSAIDAVAAEPYVDEKKVGCVGASYGGFTVYWMAGNHNKRFSAFISHSGIFNLDAQYLETEEMWFENWDMGGSFWDHSNATAKRSFANSPHRFVDKWDTPILCIHGEKDYRILASQGMQAFNAAKLRGIPAELLVFPDENHWIIKPQNSILWQRTFFAWLDKWLK
jgi:dipeptidyl aminopeptidase/acylaminoacyl peptidase